MLSIEGRIRDLALAEVFQLLSRGRKSGTLLCEAPLLSRAARVLFAQGAIVDAAVATIDAFTNDGDVAGTGRREESRGIEEAALDVLCWRDGTFRFQPGPVVPLVRLAVEPLLIEAAQRAIVWDRIEGRVPHARVVPAFMDLEPGQLPELRLSPPQWELLAHVDGERDLVMLATVMQREFTDVAELVYELIGAGLLTLREAPVAPRRNPTPPVNAAVPLAERQTPPWTGQFSVAGAAVGQGGHDDDLWVPDQFSAAEIRMPGDRETAAESVFDPVEVGVLTPEGLPALELPYEAVAGPVAGPLAVSDSSPIAVARADAEPSSPWEQEAVDQAFTPPTSDGPSLCRQGDDLLRRSDLMGAVTCWEAALRATVPVDDAERLREVIALAIRLHALVPR
jgi:hypothetical protein